MRSTFNNLSSYSRVDLIKLYLYLLGMLKWSNYVGTLDCDATFIPFS